jgi:hypothetical protein
MGTEMMTFKEYCDYCEEKFTRDFTDRPTKLQTEIPFMYTYYLGHVAKIDGRTVKWHVNKALDQYVKSLKES